MTAVQLLEIFGFKGPADLALFSRIVRTSPAPVFWQFEEFAAKAKEIILRPVARPQQIYMESTVYNCLRRTDYTLYAWKSLYQWTTAIRHMIQTPNYDLARVIMPACYSCGLATGGWCEDCDCRDGALNTDLDRREVWAWRPLCSVCEEEALLCSFCQEAGSELA